MKPQTHKDHSAERPTDGRRVVAASVPGLGSNPATTGLPGERRGSWKRHAGGRRGIAALAALAIAALLPGSAAAAKVTWGEPFQTGTGYTTITLQVENDNPGTTYTSVTLDSLTRLIQAYGIDTAGRTGEKKNIGLTINSGAGYVNQGWDVGIDSQGRISIEMIPGYEDPDPFLFGDVFFLTVGFNNAYLLALGKDPASIQLGANAWGLTDSGWDGGGNPWATQPALVPLPAGGGESLALAVSVSPAGGVRLAVETWNVGSFRLRATERLSPPDWRDLGVHAVTGRVTVVTVPHAVPSRFFQAQTVAE